MGYLKFEGIRDGECKLKGIIKNQDVPLLYSFDELYKLFIQDYVQYWINKNK